VKDPQKSPPSEQVEIMHLVRGVITALDFPISTPVSGLEKIFAHFSDPYWEDFGLDLDIPDPGDFVEHPTFDGCTALRSMFIGACAERACEFYRQLVRDNVPEPVAFFAGIGEGRRCMYSRGYGSSATGSSHSPALVDPSDLVFGWYRRRRRGH
jgi:hypothetical protein